MASEGGSEIYWPAYCGEDDKDWAFWDYELTVNTTQPDLTLCFQLTALAWTPCGFLWLCALFYAPYLASLRTIHSFHDSSIFSKIKLVLGFLLCALSLVNLFWAVGHHQTGVYRYPVFYVASVAFFITYVLATWLIHYEFRKGVHSSGVLWLFWLLAVLCAIIPFRSYILRKNANGGKVEDMGQFVVFYVTFVLVAIQFLLAQFADKKALSVYTEEDALDSERMPLLGSATIARNRPIQIGEVGSEHDPCPELKATFLSRVTYWWMSSLIYRGYKKTLVFSDLWKIRPQDRSECCYGIFRQQWEKELAKARPESPMTFAEVAYSQTKEPSFTKSIFKTYGVYYTLAGLFKLLYDILSFIQPQLLSLLITYVSSGDVFQWHGIFFAIVLFVSTLVRSVVMQKFSDITFKVGMKLRSAVIATVYRKSLRLSSSAKRETTQGEIVNLMSVDAQRLQDCCVQFHYSWSAPLIIIVCLILLWQQLGLAVLAGLVVLILMIPLNAFVAGRVKKYQTTQMIHKDKRIVVANEVLNGMKVLKLYAWEPSFITKITGIRENEIEQLKYISYLNAGSSIFWFVGPSFVALASFAVYAYMDPSNYLDAQRVFVSLSYFNTMNVPLSIFPLFINQTVQAYVSIKRLTKFLVSEEIDEDNVETDATISDPVLIRDGNFSWGSDAPTVLKKINLDVKDGTLIAVIGSVGSGKTSLISTLLGDMYKKSGLVHVRGSMAYVPQQAWIQNCTLEENIIFGKEKKEAKYKQIVEACALASDLKILPGGDQTEIGDKGINLSGGQKQRVSLARAVYQNADIYLLDDPLSAVDAHVGKHIFDKVIGNNGVLKGKTRIFVTHNVAYLPKVDNIAILHNGQLVRTGKYKDLLENDPIFAEFIRTYLLEEEEDEEEEAEIDPETVELKKELRRQVSIQQDDEEPGFAPKVRRRSLSRSKSIQEELNVLKEIMEKKKLTTEEVAEKGEVSWRVYWEYMRALGTKTSIIILLSYACYVASSIGTSFWVTYWSNDPPPVNGTADRKLQDTRVGVYGALVFAQALTIFIQALAISLGTVAASGLLHNELIDRIMRSPMAFFDTTPLGRIVNRMSKDLETVDNLIPFTIRFLLLMFASVLSTIIIISISVPYFLIALVPLALMYYFIQKLYISTSRQLKRIDSIKRSPIFSHFGASLSGASSIRCYRQTDRFIATSDRLVDEGNMAYFANIMSIRWLGIILEFIGNCIVLFASLFAVLGRDSLDPGTVGLIVSYALQITAALNFVVRNTCDMETYIVSVERIDEYAKLPIEAPWDMPSKKPPRDWPDKGEVVFDKYSVRYRPGLDLVLKSIDGEVNPGEKVGIVGRTGAGKSSLTLALFRLIEAAEGSICIDGRNISELGLHDLRSKLTIIPQDPVLFSGTIRTNLDPIGDYSDLEVWSALEQAHLKPFVLELDTQLQYEVSENGENLSVGQRQLVCLARALLRRTKILILDEATAAVDMATDDLIQNTIRIQFKGCTVLTIAHRLSTIMDYNRIMVLDQGIVKEFDSPTNLLKDKQTIFYGMAQDAGLV